MNSYDQVLNSENLVVNECRYDDYDIIILYFTFDDEYRAYVIGTYEGPTLIASKEGFNNFQEAVNWAEIVMDNDARNFEESVSKNSNKSTVRESIKNMDLKEGKLHPFTKNDWYGYAGAEKFPDGSDPLIYSDPETDSTVIVSYDDYTDDIIVQAIIVDDEGEGTSFTKTYQGDKQKAIADAEDIISKGWLSTGDTNAFGSDWERGIG